jgi:hypothetical protein
MITSWSPSRLASYTECPKKAGLEFDKVCPVCFHGTLKGWAPQTCTKCGGSPPSSPVLDRGTRLHLACEDYLTGKEQTLSDELKPVKKWLMPLRTGFRKSQVLVERQVAVDCDWKPVEWFDRRAWLRCKIDVLDCRKAKTWAVVDWKTGKYKPDGEYGEQLALYATIILSAFPQPQSVAPSLVFIDAGKGVEHGAVARKDLKEMQNRWADRTMAMLNDTVFAPRPSYACRWCPWSKAKGSPLCPF